MKILNPFVYSTGRSSPHFASSRLQIALGTSGSVEQNNWQKAEEQYGQALQLVRQTNIGRASSLLKETLNVTPAYLPSYNLLGIMQLAVPQDFGNVGYDGIGSFLFKNTVPFTISPHSFAEAENTLNQGVLQNEHAPFFPQPYINLGNIALLQAAWSNNADIIKPNIQRAIESYSMASFWLKGFNAPDPPHIPEFASYSDQAAYLKRILAHNVALLEKIMECKGVQPIRGNQKRYLTLQNDIKAVKPGSIQKLNSLSVPHLAAHLLYPVI